MARGPSQQCGQQELPKTDSSMAVRRRTVAMVLLLLLGALASLTALSAASSAGFYTVSGAGNATANGVYHATASADTFLAAATGLTLFRFEQRWYVGKAGSGPVLYQGACTSTSPPSNWTTYVWKGATSPKPPPRVESTKAPAVMPCAACDYTLSQAGAGAADGCYTRSAPSHFTRKDSAIALYRRASPGVGLPGGEWVIGIPGGADLYASNCNSSTLPPAAAGWHANAAAVPIGHHKPPMFSATVAFPLGYCPPTPPPPAKPHPRCATPECVALHGRLGCPDLNGIAPDLVRPPMLAVECPVPGSGCRTASAAAVAPGAGRRVRAVAPGFEHTRAYHPLYLPSDWQPATATAATAQAAGKAVTKQKKKEEKKKKKYPIIVEYMGNGPFNDKEGDISTGRPEDSNLGWGMAEPAGTKYIWISMPMLSADLVCENASFGASYT
jgi:hypothetical protein